MKLKEFIKLSLYVQIFGQAQTKFNRFVESTAGLSTWLIMPFAVAKCSKANVDKAEVPEFAVAELGNATVAQINLAKGKRASAKLATARYSYVR